MPPEPLILAFDTSAAHCAAVLLLGDRVLAARSEVMGRGQAERLIPMLQEIMDAGHFGWGDLTAIAVGVGPGNFTGIRIAVSAARGLALALGIRSIGVTTFEALAWGGKGLQRIVLDGRQDMVFVQEFRDGRAVSAARMEPGQAPAETLPDVAAIARVAATRLDGEAQPARPCYIREADAARAVPA